MKEGRKGGGKERGMEIGGREGERKRRKWKHAKADVYLCPLSPA